MQFYNIENKKCKEFLKNLIVFKNTDIFSLKSHHTGLFRVYIITEGNPTLYPEFNHPQENVLA